MRIGIVSPVVTRVPGAHSEWEVTAGIAELARVAEHADALGFAHLTCSEHVAVPVDVAAQRGGTYWDPLATFGYLAARTERIRFVTQVLVLGYHHPLEIAKRYGTLDAVTGGRMTLGVGVGSLEAEFDLLGAAFAGRGARADDALRALRSALSVPLPWYQGPHYSFGDVLVEPHALQATVPLWVGGRSMRSLRRAAALGDGWVPFGLPLGRIREMLENVEAPEGFDVVLSAGVVDPIGDPVTTAERLDATVSAGATTISVSIAAESVDHYCEQLSALAKLAEVEE
ncbi:TIGR03619 family F420-dependent LLM class oxidoreductase [Nocardia cerradoensis]|uniref:Limonene 1,2-monooxygenase n=1 Tax=Nocardia cerradoensis TaxID=85688 RepID=A0A231GU33_9NOCA|nr:TIGR03619 family F420-dependent LLM class oxidoreductase [Nocardia cerradoensis]NKY43734.1 TIGR03619 family F420-dependent LLM class oxidoreductase [Nocardia cerradoensis]OXR40102.1 Limonene 1,2-monooxygenase [Nocardia cerradoensis]